MGIQSAAWAAATATNSRMSKRTMRATTPPATSNFGGAIVVRGRAFYQQTIRARLLAPTIAMRVPVVRPLRVFRDGMRLFITLAAELLLVAQDDLSVPAILPDRPVNLDCLSFERLQLLRVFHVCVERHHAE